MYACLCVSMCVRAQVHMYACVVVPMEMELEVFVNFLTSAPQSNRWSSDRPINALKC